MTREEAINNLESLYNEVYNEDSDGYIYAEAMDMAIEALQFTKHFDLLKEFQSLQEVVRCKDCRHCTEYYDRDGYPYWICDEWDSGTDADGYCHCGERKKK